MIVKVFDTYIINIKITYTLLTLRIKSNTEQFSFYIKKKLFSKNICSISNHSHITRGCSGTQELGKVIKNITVIKQYLIHVARMRYQGFGVSN